ncbi:MAG TPA: HAD-IA family hydrolase [Candidatus Paceibacterota bacterium]|nr:HAD-IA family hydrolase [Verrucomicrobiota bacterium]HRY47090.1 HAD-IA family hydrolase [Candidatus Paceibacterota bacterium]HRZ99939.1 HAD-IA family hydrolase [Candidatus Paceibacterota bacterium]
MRTCKVDLTLEFSHGLILMASPSIQAVLFDMDGVLTDSEPLICEAAVRMFQEQGLPVQPEDFLPFVGTGEDRYLGGVAEKYGFKIHLAESKKRTYEIYLALVPDQLKAFPGAVELVRTCKAHGLAIALVSSADTIKIHANLNKIGLPSNLWNAIVTAEHVQRKKPAPDLFLSAAKILNLPSGACVVIEDAINGIEAARAANMRCVAVAQTFPSDRLQLADRIRPSVADLTLDDLMNW